VGLYQNAVKKIKKKEVHHVLWDLAFRKANRAIKWEAMSPGKCRGGIRDGFL